MSHHGSNESNNLVAKNKLEEKEGNKKLEGCPQCGYQLIRVQNQEQCTLCGYPQKIVEVQKPQEKIEPIDIKVIFPYIEPEVGVILVMGAVLILVAPEIGVAMVLALIPSIIIGSILGGIATLMCLWGGGAWMSDKVTVGVFLISGMSGTLIAYLAFISSILSSGNVNNLVEASLFFFVVCLVIGVVLIYHGSKPLRPLLRRANN